MNRVKCEKKDDLMKIMNIICWSAFFCTLLIFILMRVNPKAWLTLIGFLVGIIITGKKQEYTLVKCDITFRYTDITWKYFDMVIPGRKGKVHVEYNINISDIQSVTIDAVGNFAEILCNAYVTYTTSDSYEDLGEIDDCYLEIHNYSMNKVQELFQKYTDLKIDIVD